ncbi:hydrogenase maturation nickel metallochaperone HypA [Streptosporangium saharense]|uniref:hydrogenase maturation nickel metallochaperone HypA/HybF n=1 Tax=Streptosporangium saharense TaxID=1706840 RepID=UPI003684E16A
MHEFGIAEAVLDAVERRAQGRKVARLRVRAGAMLRITGPAFEQAFTMVAPGSVAEGAATDLVVIPARLACRTCGGDEETYDALAVCGGCASTDVDLSGGDELTLESIEFEEVVSHVSGDSGGDRGDPDGSR